MSEAYGGETKLHPVYIILKWYDFWLFEFQHLISQTDDSQICFLDSCRPIEGQLETQHFWVSTLDIYYYIWYKNPKSWNLNPNRAGVLSLLVMHPCNVSSGKYNDLAFRVLFLRPNITHIHCTVQSTWYTLHQGRASQKKCALQQGKTRQFVGHLIRDNVTTPMTTPRNTSAWQHDATKPNNQLSRI